MTDESIIELFKDRSGQIEKQRLLSCVGPHRELVDMQFEELAEDAGLTWMLDPVYQSMDGLRQITSLLEKLPPSAPRLLSGIRKTFGDEPFDDMTLMMFLAPIFDEAAFQGFLRLGIVRQTGARPIQSTGQGIGFVVSQFRLSKEWAFVLDILGWDDTDETQN
jgi:hypothetical protein